jgi:hypothetical protein
LIAVTGQIPTACRYYVPEEAFEAAAKLAESTNWQK